MVDILEMSLLRILRAGGGFPANLPYCTHDYSLAKQIATFGLALPNPWMDLFLFANSATSL